MIRRFLALVFCATLCHTAWAHSVAESNLSSQVLLVAQLSGSKVVPAVQTQAQGLVFVLLNREKDTAYVSGTVTGLSSAITGIHIHRGRAGENGDVVVDLMSFLRGNVVAGAVKLSTLPSAVIEAALRGELYVAVHTASIPGGELRGQLEAETDIQLSGMLSGSAQVPPVMTNASGMVVGHLRKDGKKLWIWATFNGTAQVTAAHLHRGAAGSNGDVVADLSSMINGNAIVGVVDASNFVDILLAGQVYLNIHTSQYPNGEIRAQLEPNAASQLAFELWLDGNQQVPVVMTNGRGVGRLWVTARYDTLYWDMYVGGLSSMITGVHVHRGKVGASGDVLVDLSGSVQQNGWIRGKSAVTPGVVEAMLRGEAYVNVHTQSNPNGEIRGQVWRLLREGFVISLDGMQQVPSVMTMASGTGIVSIDRKSSSVRYAYVLNGLMPQAIHFHAGKRGQNGDVLYDISSSVRMVGMVGAYGEGYWTTESNPALGHAALEAFFSDSVYMNVHTMMYPNGETRGQVSRQYAPMGISTAEEHSQTSLQLYPNPASTTLWISTEPANGLLRAWTIFTMHGERILAGTVEASAQGYAIDISSLPCGFYLLQCTFSSSNHEALPFLKQ